MVPPYKYTPDWVEEACRSAHDRGLGMIVLVIPVAPDFIRGDPRESVVVDVLTDHVRDQIVRQVKMVRGGVPAEMREPPRGQ